MNNKQLSVLEKEGYVLPNSYKKFLKDCNDQPETVCVDFSRISLYSLALFQEMQISFDMKEYCPKYIAVGSGSGGENYAIS